MTVQFSAIASTLTDVCEKFVTMPRHPVTHAGIGHLEPCGDMDVVSTPDQGESGLAREEGGTFGIQAS
ncbi:hypothetical protein AXG94_18400 [Pseudomonas corrugata]|nr:hypothetical protein AXG94_18400 [Pseudomonas corrugata]